MGPLEMKAVGFLEAFHLCYKTVYLRINKNIEKD